LNRAEAISTLVAALAAGLTPGEREDALVAAWSLRETAPEFLALPEELKRRMVELEEPENPDDPAYAPLLALALRWPFRGVLNSWLEERLASLGIRATVEGPIEPTVTCPCCGFFSLTDRGDWEICRVCQWEDTGDDLDVHSGPNHMTLREGRANFVRSGVCDPRISPAMDPDRLRRYRR
jgi:hypothetical protein